MDERINGERIEVRSPFAFRLLTRKFELRSKLLTFGNVQINLTFRSLNRNFVREI